MLRAQGLERAPGEVTNGAVQRAALRLGVIQIDSVNVLARAHYLPLYSRLGAYPRAELDRLFSNSPRSLLEQWGHEACLVSPEVHRLLAPLRARWASSYVAEVEARSPGVMDAIHRVIAEHGALTARQVQAHLLEEFPALPKGGGGWWSWSAVKEALEISFHAGTLASAGRNASFERHYDLVDRLVPKQRTQPSVDEAIAELTLRSLRHLGIGTLASIADYYRLKRTPVAAALAELERTGLAERVVVTGLKAQMWKDPAATAPRAATATTLLSPFDPLIFERERALNFFGLHYRIGIYTPAPQRETGYYSLPLLMGEQITSRYDLKADRGSGVLLVNGAFAEPQWESNWPSEAAIVHAAVSKLRHLADWLGLGDVVVPDGAPGALVASLSHTLGTHG